MIRRIEAGTIAVMLICGAAALAGCTAVAMVVVFVMASVIRAGIEVMNIMEEMEGQNREGLWTTYSERTSTTSISDSWPQQKTG